MAISLCFSLSVSFSHQSPSLLAALHLVTILPSSPSLDPVIHSSCRAAGCKLQLRPFSRTKMETMQNNLGTIQRVLKAQSVGLQWVNLSNKFPDDASTAYLRTHTLRTTALMFSLGHRVYNPLALLSPSSLSTEARANHLKTDFFMSKMETVTINILPSIVKKRADRRMYFISWVNKHHLSDHLMH